MSDALQPGAKIGILGGGQLGRMLSVAASRLGFVTHIFEPGANPPAGQVADRVTTAAYDDAEALKAFAESVDVITYEFENIPTEALDLLEAHRPIRPGREALRVSQDRLTEKNFLQELGLQTAPFADITDLDSLNAAIEQIGTPAILKTRRFGYDGKGQARLRTPEDAQAALADMAGAPAILEGFVEFSTRSRSSRPADWTVRSPVSTPVRTRTAMAFCTPRRSLPVCARHSVQMPVLPGRQYPQRAGLCRRYGGRAVCDACWSDRE